MIDEIFDREYQAGRTELNAAIFGVGRRFAAAVGNVFAVLNRIEYSAPWVAPAKHVRPPERGARASTHPHSSPF